MLAKFVGCLIVSVCLDAGCSSPCGFFSPKHLYMNPGMPEYLQEQPFRDGNSEVIGTFPPYFSGYSGPGSLYLELDRPPVSEAPGMATYTLAVYDGESPCPPESGSPMTSYGNATDSNTDSSISTAIFIFDGQGLSQPDAAFSLAGKILVLRAVHPELEPNASVACTSLTDHHPGGTGKRGMRW